MKQLESDTTVGIVLDEFAGLAGASDFLLSIVNGLQLARPNWTVRFIYQKPPGALALGRISARVRAVAKALIRRQPIALPRVAEPQAIIARLRQDGLPDEPIALIAPGARALEARCEAAGIDVVLPFVHPPKRPFAIPWVGYIFDFQHSYYPSFFTDSERRWRNRLFRTMLSQARSVIVNARAVRSDAEKFLAPFDARIFALPFSASPMPAWLTTDPDETRERYSIGSRYFIVSNQFWVHKRHDVAISALAALAADDVELVMTGATHDPRAPNHFASLQAKVRSLGLDERVHFLGLVPKLDQIALLRGAVALIQPTSFEGGPGGGSVFDAVALGQRAIVSDIPVNREIAEYGIRYVPLGDALALSEAMAEALADRPETAPPGEELLALGRARRKAMGECVAAAAEYAMDGIER